MGKFPNPSEIRRSFGPINRGLRLLMMCVIKESLKRVIEAQLCEGCVCYASMDIGYRLW